MTIRASPSSCPGARSSASSSRRTPRRTSWPQLQKAYAEGAKHPDFVKLIDDRGFKMMNLSGAEAEPFLKKWQSTTAWIVFDAGIAKKSPEEFNIAKP